MTDDKNNKSRQIPIVCPGHTRPLAELQFVHVKSSGEQRTFLLSACHDRMPMLRDGVSGDWIGTFVGHKGAVWSCQMDDSGSLAATASGDFSCKIWDAITGQSLLDLPHKHIVKTCVFSPNSTRLATGGKEAVLRIFNLKDTLLSSNGKSSMKGAPPAMEIKQASPITKLLWMSDTVVFCACADGNIYVWDIPEPIPSEDGSGTTTNPAPPTQPTHTLSTKDGDEIRDMELCSITGSSKQILTVAAGTKVYFFDVEGPAAMGTCLHSYTMPIHFREEGGASLHPSGTKFVAGGSDLWVRVFDYATGQELECHKGHHGPIRCVRYAPDGNSYATGSEDGTIRLWKTDPESE